jgi:hypothetical protein
MSFPVVISPSFLQCAETEMFIHFGLGNPQEILPWEASFSPELSGQLWIKYEHGYFG